MKYCSKPQDTLAASDDELVWLYRATQRLKLCQPLGDFAVWLRELTDAGEKVVRVHIGRGDGRLMRVKKRQKAGAEAVTERTASNGGEEPADAVAVSGPERRQPLANIVLGLTLPQWRHTPWAEPMIMVQHYDPLRLSDEAGCGIREWQRQAREMWDGNWAPKPEEALRVARLALDAALPSDDIREAAEAASYIVHTCRPTVRDAIEEVAPDEVSELVADLAAILGGRVVRLVPRPPCEDDVIPFEAAATVSMLVR